MPSSDYIDDSHFHHQNMSDDEDDDYDMYNMPLEYHDWTTWYSNDLMNLWMSMCAYLRDSYLERPMRGEMTYDDFCQFFYTYSHRVSSKHAT